jgi:hypothetical protein
VCKNFPNIIGVYIPFRYAIPSVGSTVNGVVSFDAFDIVRHNIDEIRRLDESGGNIILNNGVESSVILCLGIRIEI